MKVTGSSGAVSHSVSVTVTVTPPPPPPPDFGISTFPNSMVLIGGGSGTGAVSVSGLNFTGNVQLSSIVTPDLSNGPVSSVTPASVFITPFQSSGYAVLTISTTSATPTGNYTITITGTSGALTHAVLLQLTVLPPPVLTVSPSSGRLGDMVTIHGSGFFVMPGAPIALPVELEITFDSPLLGVVFPQNGSFTFVFNVPHADPTKLHHIHAIGLFPSNLDVQANFTVLPEPASSTPGVSLSTGSLYFPGDTLTIYIQTTQNGALVGPAGVQLQVSITWPNGTSSALNPVSVGTGLYKASFTVPKNGSTGTYAVTATVSVDGTQASALDTFEVKPAWVSPGGPTILSALSLPDSMPTIAILGMIIAGVAVLGLAFLTRKVGKSEKQTLPLK